MFIPFWGFLVFLLYSMRRGRLPLLQYRVRGGWSLAGDGKHQLTKAYMLFLVRWARKLSWKDAAESFRTTWDKVHDAVQYVVAWGLEHRTLGPDRGHRRADEIQYARATST